MKLDHEKYWDLVKDFDMSDDQKRELIETVWHIMGNFVDRAFGLDPTQQAIAAADKNTGNDQGEGLGFEYNQKSKRQPRHQRRQEYHGQKSSHLRPRL